MTKYSLHIVMMIVLIILAGCNNTVTKDDLIGGKWVPISGYEDGEASGDPVCPPFDKGIEFKDEETVYVEDREKDFTYDLRQADYGTGINFLNPNGQIDFFEIFIDKEDNLVMIGSGTGVSGSFNCYYEREG